MPTYDLDKIAEGARIPRTTRPRDKAIPVQVTALDIIPSAGPIQTIHRHTDGYITFHAPGATGKWGTLFAALPQELDEIFPQFLNQLSEDGYYSINAFKGKHRRTAELKRLTACYIDLDCHKKGLPLDDVAGVIAKWETGSEGLPVSIKVFSGHGMWLFWMLHTDGMALDATPETVGLYATVQRAIKNKFLPLGADRFDAARITRVPGSVNTGADKVVRYQVNLDPAGRLMLYTLDRIAGVFDAQALPRVDIKPRPLPKPKPNIPDDIREVKRRGWIARMKYPLDDFNTLRDIRGGFREGYREKAAYIYAGLLFRAGYKRVEVTDYVFDLIADCDPNPHITDGEIMNAINQAARQKGYLTYGTISDYLGITEEESAMLVKLPAAGGERKKIILEPPRKGVTIARRRVLKMHIEHWGGVPTIRVIREHLAAMGLEASTRTIHKDLEALGIDNPRRRKKIPPDQGLFEDRETGT